MAGVRKKGNAYYCTFRFQGRRDYFIVGTVESGEEAGARAALLAEGHRSAAYYLAGYAVECGLKACIAKLTLEKIQEAKKAVATLLVGMKKAAAADSTEPGMVVMTPCTPIR